MATLSQLQKSAWDARLERIQSGQTMTQIREAEGTVPLQLKKQSSSVLIGFYGPAAWIMGGGIGWSIATLTTSLQPTAQLVADRDLKQYTAPILEYGDPIIAALFFLISLSFLRINGSFAKLVGLIAMAWPFAMTAGVEMPALAEMIELGRSLVAGEESFATAFAQLQTWAAAVFA